MLVKRYQEHLVCLQEAQDRGAVVAPPQRIAQRGAEALLAGGFIEEGLHVGRQHVDDLFEQIVADQALAPVQGLWQALLVGALADRQLPEAQPCHPPVAALDQVVQRLASQAVGLATDHRQRFFGGQPQLLFVELHQLP